MFQQKKEQGNWIARPASVGVMAHCRYKFLLVYKSISVVPDFL